MKKILGIIAILLAASPYVNAEESVVDKAKEVKHEAGKEVRHAAREVKATGRHVRQAVIVRCADGRHAVKRKGDCDGHGGVRDPK